MSHQHQRWVSRLSYLCDPELHAGATVPAVYFVRRVEVDPDAPVGRAVYRVPELTIGDDRADLSYACCPAHLLEALAYVGEPCVVRTVKR